MITVASTKLTPEQTATPVLMVMGIGEQNSLDVHQI